MINSPQNPDLPIHFRYKRLLTALVMGLLLRVLVLANDGMLDLLSTERRIILILIALRLLIMVHSSFGTVDQAKPDYTGWRARILPLFFVFPPLVVFWLAAWSTGGSLLGITGYALAVSLITLLAILNFAVTWMKPSQESSAERGDVYPKYANRKFLVDMVFYGAYGLIFAVGIIGFMVIAPEALDDSIAIGSLAFNVYLMIWVIQGIFWFFSNLIRQATVETGLRQ